MTQHPRRLLALVVISLLISGCASVIGATSDGPIEDDPRKRTLGAQIDDEGIETKVLVNIKKADAGFEKAQIDVVSHNGLVLLVGQVQSEALRQLAGEVAMTVRRVRRVQNELAVAGPVTLLVRMNDSLVTSRVKLALYGDDEAPGSLINVTTENGVVYLMGILPREQADRAAEVASGVRGVTKVVKVFEYLEDSGA